MRNDEVARVWNLASLERGIKKVEREVEVEMKSFMLIIGHLMT